MASPNLGIPPIQDSNQPEIEANAAVDLLDEAMNDNVAIVVTTDVTVTAAQYNENFAMKFTGTPGAAFDVFLPSNKRKFAVWNTSGQTATIGVDDLAGGFLGTSQILTTGKIAEYLSDGTNVEATGSGAVSVLDDAIEKVAVATALNFTGAGVAVTDGGGGQANIDIPGGGGAGGEALLSTAARGALARNNATQSLTTATWTALLLQLEDADTDAFHDLVTNNSRMTVPAGVTKVRLKGNVRIAANATGLRQARITRNGATDTPHYQVGAVADSATDSTLQVETPVINVVAGDYFELEAWQNSGGALNVLNAGLDTWFAIEVVETNDTVDLSAVAVTVKPKLKGALVTKSAVQSFPNDTVTVVTFNTVQRDTDSFFDDANDTFVVPAGVSKVRLSAQVTWANNSTNRRHIIIQKNDVSIPNTDAEVRQQAHETSEQQLATPVLDVVEGDTFRLQGLQNSTVALDVAGGASTWFEIAVVEETGAGTQPTGFIAIQPLPRGTQIDRSTVQNVTTPSEIFIPDTEIWARKSVRGNNWWLGPDFIFVDADVSVANDTVTEVAHGMETADGPFELTTTGTLPAGLALTTAYWAIRVDNDTFKFATSIANALADSAVNITAAAGGGNHTRAAETRLLVPDGVTKVRITGQMRWANTTAIRTLSLLRNGASDSDGFFLRTDDATNARGEDNGSCVLAVTPGDYFEAQLGTSVTMDTLSSNMWLTIEAVEEAEALTFPGVTVDRPHIGVVARRSSNIAMTTTVAIDWNAETFDTGHLGVPFHDTGTNPDRITIPAGVVKVQFSANIGLQTVTAEQQFYLTKNGSRVNGGFWTRHESVETAYSISSAVLEVAEGDIFRIVPEFSSGSPVLRGDIAGGSYFGMTVIETEESAFPPEEVASTVPSANGAPLAINTIEYAKVAVRRFSLFDEFAGSVGVATTAPTVTTQIFDVKRNGTIIGTITFAVAATTATFVTTAAIEEVFAIGDILTIETQATVNTVIRGVSFNLWAWRS